eukprot:IDg18873t1
MPLLKIDSRHTNECEALRSRLFETRDELCSINMLDDVAVCALPETKDDAGIQRGQFE